MNLELKNKNNETHLLSVAGSQSDKHVKSSFRSVS